MKHTQGIDRAFITIIAVLVIFGFAVFLSASMGLLATNAAAFSAAAFKQAFFGIVLGVAACFVFSRVPYVLFRRYALFLFLGSLFVTAAVFIPHIGVKINGARRWLLIAGISFQPVAFLNIGFTAYFAAWLASAKEKVATFRYGPLPLLVLVALVGAILIKQPDTTSFTVIAVTGVSMLLIAGGRIRHILILGLIGIACIAALAIMRPYVMSRIETFLHPADNALTSGYQVAQSEIALGSGGFLGRGLGQSIEKYQYLPVSTSDAIFAILGEELGFVGCLAAIVLFLIFAFRGFRIAVTAPDAFGGLFAAGIVIIVIVQSFANIGSTIGVIPFSGVPLAFFSQGGTSMLAMLAELGIILNISKSTKE
ncbi:MAG: cell division protein FtsW [Patescibacteria group bacterium]|nr:putative lipid II flippase FtsW [Patescibacteria group bacterium]MDE1945928.1 cell division protein FtsW [Patescibacteria group bacterium]